MAIELATIPDDLPHVHFMNYLLNVELAYFRNGQDKLIMRYRVCTDSGWSKWRKVGYYPDVDLEEYDEAQ